MVQPMSAYTAETRVFAVNSEYPDPTVIHQAADVIRAGGLVAFPTETVYGLGANATDANAVSRIFSAKGRPATDPIIVHVAALEQLDSVARNIPDLARTLAAQFFPGPLTLVLQRNETIPSNVSAGRDSVAVRMPSHPVARALLQAAGVPVAAPSANTFSRPSATTAQHALEDLNGRVDIILDGGATPIGVESTVLDLTGETPVVLRPGGISLEMLAPYISNIKWQPKYLHIDENAASPGQLTKHYSPDATVLLFDGEREAVFERMLQTARDEMAHGRKVGILAVEEECPIFEALPVRVVSLGSEGNLAQISANLFAALRQLDRLGVDLILAHGFGCEGLGAAIWDRLVRAAEGKVIEA
jgi:L-threonylcarbamoyladenylate synthase